MEQFEANSRQAKQPVDIGNSAITDNASARVDALVERALREGQLTFTLTDEGGLHMRPTDQIVQAVASSRCIVGIVHADQVNASAVDGRSIISLLMLGAKFQEVVTVSASEGDQEAFWRQVLAFDFWQVKE